ncbi:DoxX family protein [Staphylococcus simiae]|uniref:DoxX family protein n=1 Tax=Staphylococcus simiae TaxID=308354 RepID=UPI000B94ED51|nr:DoxX family protein [Staphylococcus simiae]PNZ08879.1 DoxX family protein [Staphylococcus simiae]SNV75288.1 DoxX family protein [Staphylococcus simiae]
MRIAMLLIRVMLGITFIAYGSQMVFSGFGEPMAMMTKLGFPAFFGILLGLFEFIGGILLVLGVLTNYVSVGIIVVMLGALFYIHIHQGYIASQYVITLIVMSIAVILSNSWKKIIQIY